MASIIALEFFRILIGLEHEQFYLNDVVQSIYEKPFIRYGALAHLVERNNGIVEANGSNPLRSIRLLTKYYFLHIASEKVR